MSNMSRKFSISAGVKTLFIGMNQIHLSETASTNNYAAEMLRQVGTIEGTVITADYQFGGRGQRERQWKSAPKENLLCTFVLKPTWLQLEKQFLLNKAIALAVHDTADAFSPGSFIRIKWPNDILLENKKLSGILVENTVQSGQIVSTLAGIGFNVNQEKFDEDSGKPVSLKLELGVSIDVKHVLETLSSFLEGWYLRLKSGKYDQIEDAYNAALWRRDEWQEFTVEDKKFEGKIVGCDANGKLKIEKRNAEIKSFSHGEIFLSL
jgi:BirA family transcriptional regulator, biotin operon repressor / biotin---[acetyl-CoA-carboxylase] ligase